MFFVSALPVDFVIDIATISFISVLLILSLFSVCYIFHIRFKSRSSRNLQNFNSLWTVRFLLVILIALWAFSELLRLSYFQRRLFFRFELTESHEINLCKVHLVLSLGFFEPGFLATLLFLIEVSVKNTNRRSFISFLFVLSSYLPILVLQFYFLFFPNFDTSLFTDGNLNASCAYPLVNTVLFAVLGTVFSVSFVVPFSNVVSHVNNKVLRVRIFVLAGTVLITLPVQILCLGLSAFWIPDKKALDGFTFVAFLSVFTCAMVIEGIMVIRPIADSLAAEGGETCRDGEDEEGACVVVEGG